MTQQSFLGWTISALGVYMLILPVVALLCVVLILLVLIRGKGAMAAATLILVPPIPMLVGIFAAVQGLLTSYTVIAAAGSPRPADVAVGVSTSLVAPLAAMLLTAPIYAVAVVGALVRSMLPESEHPQKLSHPPKHLQA
jgi:hypothetical protein